MYDYQETTRGSLVSSGFSEGTGYSCCALQVLLSLLSLTRHQSTPAIFTRSLVSAVYQPDQSTLAVFYRSPSLCSLPTRSLCFCWPLEVLWFLLFLTRPRYSCCLFQVLWSQLYPESPADFCCLLQVPPPPPPSYSVTNHLKGVSHTSRHTPPVMLAVSSPQ